MNPSASFLAGRQVSGSPSAPPVSAGSSQGERRAVLWDDVHGGYSGIVPA